MEASTQFTGEVIVSVDRQLAGKRLEQLASYLEQVSSLTIDSSKPLPKGLKDVAPTCRIRWKTLRIARGKPRGEYQHTLVCDLIVAVTRPLTDKQLDRLRSHLSRCTQFTRDFSKPLPPSLKGQSFSASIHWTLTPAASTAVAQSVEGQDDLLDGHSPEEINRNCESWLRAYDDMKRAESVSQHLSDDNPVQNIEVVVDDDYINVECPHCHQLDEVYRGAAERGSTFVCNCGWQYSVQLPLPPIQHSFALTCPHCHQQICVNRSDVEAGSTFACSCKGRFTVTLQDKHPVTGGGYKFRLGGFDEAAPPPSMPYVQVPCRLCAQTGFQAGVNYIMGRTTPPPCQYCGGKGWILAPNG